MHAKPKGDSPTASRLEAISRVLESALDAQRKDALADWLSAHPTLTRWLTQWLFPPVSGILAGCAEAAMPTSAAQVVLHWLVQALRPDRATGGSPISNEQWLERTSWRPYLGILCHFGFAAVPAFKDRYHHAPGAGPIDHLCGLWNIGPSTFYRYLEKGRKQGAQLIDEQMRTGRYSPNLRLCAQAHVEALLGLDKTAMPDWHRAQATAASVRGDQATAIWQWRRAGNLPQACAVVLRDPLHSASDGDILVQLGEMRSEARRNRDRIRVALTEAQIFGVRGRDEEQLAAYQTALRIASESEDPYALGAVYSQLGRFYEPRDFDRALVCYQEGAELLMAGSAPADDASLFGIEERAALLIHLGWHYTLRKDPRAEGILTRADQIVPDGHANAATRARLSQAWGEYWRRAGQTQRAVEHMQIALMLYERLGDLEGQMKCSSNLGLIYGELGQYLQALDHHSRALRIAMSSDISPEHRMSIRLNLGTTEFYRGHLDRAIQEYLAALQLCEQHGWHSDAGRAHYNLAEAYYVRLSKQGDLADEARGDEHVAAACAIWRTEGQSALVEETQALKAAMLGNTGASTTPDRLLQAEQAAHFDEMLEIGQARKALSTALEPEAQARAHLAIARLYLQMSVKERSLARDLIDRHGLQDTVADDSQSMRDAFERDLGVESHHNQRWKRAAPDLLDDAQRARVVAHLVREKSVNKSGYASLTGVSLATASKHLARLHQLEILTQVGRGPATRYVLAA